MVRDESADILLVLEREHLYKMSLADDGSTNVQGADIAAVDEWSIREPSVENIVDEAHRFRLRFRWVFFFRVEFEIAAAFDLLMPSERRSS